MQLYDVYVFLPGGEAGDATYVASTPTTVDIGDIVAAVQVLFPNLIGCSVEPATEDKDA